MPRNIDPRAREVQGLCLFDLDDLELGLQHNGDEREAAAAEAQKIVEEEAQGFRGKLLSERVVSPIVALRTRLDEICRQELESFKHECGPFSKDQDALFGEVTSRITRKIAGSLARELKEVVEKVEKERMTVAVQPLFHLDAPEKNRAVAATGNRRTSILPWAGGTAGKNYRVSPFPGLPVSLVGKQLPRVHSAASKSHGGRN